MPGVTRGVPVHRSQGRQHAAADAAGSVLRILTFLWAALHIVPVLSVGNEFPESLYLLILYLRVMASYLVQSYPLTLFHSRADTTET